MPHPAPAARVASTPPHDDPAAGAIAAILLEGFDRHYALFRECARAAKRHFEAGNWLAIGHVAGDRIDFYDRRVDETVERARARFGADGAGRQRRRRAVGARSSGTSSAAGRPPAARVRGDVLQHRVVPDPAPRVLRQPLHLRAAGGRRPSTSTPTRRRTAATTRGARACAPTLIDVVLDFGLERRFADFRRDLRNVLAAVRAAPAAPVRARGELPGAGARVACSSATAPRTRSAASSTGRTRGRSRSPSSTTPDGTPVRRRAADGPDGPRAAVLREPRVLPGRHGGAVGVRRLPARRRARPHGGRALHDGRACRSTARRSSSATSCTTSSTRATASSSRPASAGW